MAKYKFSIEGEESVPVVVKDLLSKGEDEEEESRPKPRPRKSYHLGKVRHLYNAIKGGRTKRVAVEHHDGQTSQLAVPNHMASELKEGQKVRISIGPHHRGPDTYENFGFEGKSARLPSGSLRPKDMK